MNCPDDIKIQELVLNVLPDKERSEIKKHILQCSACKETYKQFVLIAEGIGAVVENEECLPWQELKSYAEGKSSNEQKTKIEEHVKLCHDCETLLGFYQDPAKEKAWVVKERKIFEMAHAEEIAGKVSKSIIDKLLPGKVDFKQVWEYACNLFQELSDVPLSSWPRLETSAVAGTLGFAGAAEPETMGAINIELVALGVAQGLVQGNLTDQESIEKAVSDCAKNIGAGKQLQKRLLENMPELFLRDQEKGSLQ